MRRRTTNYHAAPLQPPAPIHRPPAPCPPAPCAPTDRLALAALLDGDGLDLALRMERFLPMRARTAINAAQQARNASEQIWQSAQVRTALQQHEQKKQWERAEALRTLSDCRCVRRNGWQQPLQQMAQADEQLARLQACQRPGNWTPLLMEMIGPKLGPMGALMGMLGAQHAED